MDGGLFKALSDMGHFETLHNDKAAQTGYQQLQYIYICTVWSIWEGEIIGFLLLHSQSTTWDLKGSMQRGRALQQPSNVKNQTLE